MLAALFSAIIFNQFCSVVVLWLFRAWYGRNLLVMLYSVSWYLVFLRIWLCQDMLILTLLILIKLLKLHMFISLPLICLLLLLIKYISFSFGTWLTAYLRFYIVCNILMILHNDCFQWQKDNWCLGAVIVPNKEVCLLDNFLRYKRGVNAQVHGLHNNTKLLSTVDCQLIGKYWLSPCFLL